LKDGALYKYINNIKAYHCSGDFGWHLNSYSINGYLNGEGNTNGLYRGKPETVIYNRSQVRHPSEVWVFIENNDPRTNTGNIQGSYNLGSFMVPRHGDAWVDIPGMWHNRGANIAFADGHVIYKHWDSLATQKLGDGNFNATTPNNNDLKWLQSVGGAE
jgi:prepilin-type processing-associated H-X9-DG protein